MGVILNGYFEIRGCLGEFVFTGFLVGKVDVN